MKTTHRKKTSGFTLVEVTIAIFLTMALASSLIVIVNQHVTTFQIAMQGNFLVNDAPGIGSILNRMLNQVDHYFIYASKSDAMSAANPVNSGGVALRLYFRTPTGVMDQGIIVAEVSGSQTLLNYYAYANGQWPATASWNINNHLKAVQFSNSTGILLAQLTGPIGEVITYAGTSE